MTNTKNVAEKAMELGHDLEKVKAELKKVQSIKCRLAKQKAKSTYEVEMREVLAIEQLLKEVRVYIEPKKSTVTTISQEQIALLTYDDTIKAIKSIQSKKCNTQYATENKEDNIEYQDACRIEKLLLAHKATVKPIEENVVKKSTLQDEIARLETLNLTPQQMLEELKKLV